MREFLTEVILVLKERGVSLSDDISGELRSPISTEIAFLEGL